MLLVMVKADTPLHSPIVFMLVRDFGFACEFVIGDSGVLFGIGVESPAFSFARTSLCLS